MKNTIKKPPLITPSSGRPKTALLDLTEAMDSKRKNKRDYIQIIVVREEEEEEYLNTALNHPALDVFVFKSEHNTIGEARDKAKKLGERITEGTETEFIFMMDDNILTWFGVTLIKDPCPQLFGKTSKKKISQLTPISLGSILEHFSKNNFEGIKNFNLVGFSNSLYSNVSKRRVAYTCKPVQQAFFLNVPKLWAREDIDFNEKTENLKKESLEKGHIVKCHRYVSVKKRMKEGGVVPAKNGPAEVMKVIEGHKKWATTVNARQQQRSVMEIAKEQQNGGK